MASQTYSHGVPEVVIGYPVPPSTATPPPPPLRWWHRPIATYPASNDRKPTSKEEAAYCTPCCGGVFTIVALVLILFLFDKAHYHANFSIQSITVSTSSDATTWHIDFLVKNPRSRYSIYYDGDDASVRLGQLNAAVLNTSHTRRSRDYTSFSLSFVAENVTVFEQLNIKLRAKHKLYEDFDDAGHVDISCHNLTQRHHNIDKIECHSSFTRLKNLPLGPNWTT